MLEPEQLFLLEFLVDSVYIHRLCGKEISNRDWLLCGKTVVSFQFLNFQPQSICDNDFPSPECPGAGPQKFESGKSCLFSIPEKELTRAPGEFIIHIAVFKKQPAGILPECVQVGEAKIDITNEFTTVVCDILRKPCETPASNAIKDTFVIHTPGSNEPVGMIRLFIRLSGFGKSIVTEFSLGTGESYLFRGNEDNLYRCQQVKRSLANMPPCGVTIDTCPAKGGAGGWPMFPEPGQMFPNTVCPGLTAPPVCPVSSSPPCAPMSRAPCPGPPQAPCPPPAACPSMPPPCPASRPPCPPSPPPCPASRPPCPPPPSCPPPPPSCAASRPPCPPPSCSSPQRPRGGNARFSCLCASRDATTSMTDVAPAQRPKSSPSIMKKASKMSRMSKKSKKSSLKIPRESKKKSNLSVRLSRPTSAPSTRSARSTAFSQITRKSWTLPKKSGSPLNRSNFAASLKSMWSQLFDTDSSNTRKFQCPVKPTCMAPPKVQVCEDDDDEDGLTRRPSSTPLQKPSVRAWKRKIRGILMSSPDQECPAACPPPRQLPDRYPYRSVPAYVDLASFLYPEYFWEIVDYFMDHEEWPKWSTLDPTFQRVCAAFGVDSSSTLKLPGFAPTWLHILRDADEVVFRTIVGHFFFTHRLPSWCAFPPAVVQFFKSIGVGEFDYIK